MSERDALLPITPPPTPAPSGTVPAAAPPPGTSHPGAAAAVAPTAADSSPGPLFPLKSGVKALAVATAFEDGYLQGYRRGLGGQSQQNQDYLASRTLAAYRQDVLEAPAALGGQRAAAHAPRPIHTPLDALRRDIVTVDLHQDPRRATESERATIRGALTWIADELSRERKSWSKHVDGAIKEVAGLGASKTKIPLAGAVLAWSQRMLREGASHEIRRKSVLDRFARADAVLPEAPSRKPSDDDLARIRQQIQAGALTGMSIRALAHDFGMQPVGAAVLSPEQRAAELHSAVHRDLESRSNPHECSLVNCPDCKGEKTIVLTDETFTCPACPPESRSTGGVVEFAEKFATLKPEVTYEWYKEVVDARAEWNALSAQSGTPLHEALVGSMASTLKETDARTLFDAGYNQGMADREALRPSDHRRAFADYAQAQSDVRQPGGATAALAPGLPSPAQVELRGQRRYPGSAATIKQLTPILEAYTANKDRLSDETRNAIGRVIYSGTNRGHADRLKEAVHQELYGHLPEWSSRLEPKTPAPQIVVEAASRGQSPVHVTWIEADAKPRVFPFPNSPLAEQHRATAERLARRNPAKALSGLEYESRRAMDIPRALQWQEAAVARQEIGRAPSLATLGEIDTLMHRGALPEQHEQILRYLNKGEVPRDAAHRLVEHLRAALKPPEPVLEPEARLALTLAGCERLHAIRSDLHGINAQRRLAATHWAPIAQMEAGLRETRDAFQSHATTALGSPEAGHRAWRALATPDRAAAERSLQEIPARATDPAAAERAVAAGRSMLHQVQGYETAVRRTGESMGLEAAATRPISEVRAQILAPVERLQQKSATLHQAATAVVSRFDGGRTPTRERLAADLAALHPAAQARLREAFPAATRAIPTHRPALSRGPSL